MSQSEQTRRPWSSTFTDCRRAVSQIARSTPVPQALTDVSRPAPAGTHLRVVVQGCGKTHVGEVMRDEYGFALVDADDVRPSSGALTLHAGRWLANKRDFARY